MKNIFALSVVAPSLLILILLSSTSSVLAAEISELKVVQCNNITSHNYVVDAFWLDGRIVVPLFKYNKDANGVINVYLVLNIIQSEHDKDIKIRIRGIEYHGKDVLVYVDVSGQDIFLHVFYVVNGDVSIYIKQVNESWATVTLDLEELRGQSMGKIIDDIRGLYYTKKLNSLLWLRSLNLTFMVNMVNGSSYLIVGKNPSRLMYVGELPLFYTRAKTPRDYAEILINKTIDLLNNLYSQPDLLRKLVSTIVSEENKTLQSRRVLEVIEDLYSSISSLSYLGSKCNISILAGRLGVSCRSPLNVKFRVVSLNATLLHRSPDFKEMFYEYVVKRDYQGVARLLNELIGITTVSLENITSGMLAATYLSGITPLSERDLLVFSAPYYDEFGDLKGYIYLTRGASLGFKNIEELIRSMVPGGLTSESENIEYEHSYYPENMTLIVEIGDKAKIRLFLWLSDVNGTDRICIYSSSYMAELINASSKAWKVDSNQLRDVLIGIYNTLWRFLVAAVHEGVHSEALKDIISDLQSMREKALKRFVASLPSNYLPTSFYESRTVASAESVSKGSVYNNKTMITWYNQRSRNYGYNGSTIIVVLIVTIALLLALYMVRLRNKRG